MKKAHPELVIPQLVIKAISSGKDRGSLFSEYIVAHYRATGKLVPGCDARDFYAKLDEMQSASESRAGKLVENV